MRDFIRVTCGAVAMYFAFVFEFFAGYPFSLNFISSFFNNVNFRNSTLAELMVKHIGNAVNFAFPNLAAMGLNDRAVLVFVGLIAGILGAVAFIKDDEQPAEVVED